MNYKKNIFAELHHIYAECNFNPVERGSADVYLERVAARFEKAQLKTKYSSAIIEQDGEFLNSFAP